MKTILFLTLLFNFSNNTWANIPAFNIEEVIDLVENLKGYCPPQECIYISIGRSPVVFTTLLSMQEGTQIIHLPISGFRYDPIGNVILNPTQRQILFEHFSNYLPGNLNGKNLMLIDIAQSGNSLLSVSYFVDQYYDLHPNLARPEKIVVTGMTTSANNLQRTMNEYQASYSSRVNFNIVELQSSSSRPTSLLSAIESQQFDQFLPYNEFNIRDYMSIESYRNRWNIHPNMGALSRLKRILLEKFLRDPNLQERFPLACDSYFRPFF